MTSVSATSVPCIAVIGDVVHSRQIRDRNAAQAELVSLLDSINDRFHTTLLAPFRISSGDEIQALFAAGHALPDLVWESFTDFAHPIRYGIGRGELNTELGPDPRLTDGPAWWNARSAIRLSVATKRTGGVFIGFGERQDITLTALGTLLQHVRSGLTKRQATVLSLLRSGGDMVRIAEQLKITRQAVSRTASSAGWRAYHEGEAAWKSLLSEYDYAELWSHARS